MSTNRLTVFAKLLVLAFACTNCATTIELSPQVAGFAREYASTGASVYSLKHRGYDAAFAAHLKRIVSFEGALAESSSTHLVMISLDGLSRFGYSSQSSTYYYERHDVSGVAAPGTTTEGVWRSRADMILADIAGDRTAWELKRVDEHGMALAESSSDGVVTALVYNYAPVFDGRIVLTSAYEISISIAPNGTVQAVSAVLPAVVSHSRWSWKKVGDQGLREALLTRAKNDVVTVDGVPVPMESLYARKARSSYVLASGASRELLVPAVSWNVVASLANGKSVNFTLHSTEGSSQ